MVISREDIIDALWERRANAYSLKESGEAFDTGDIITFTHRNQVLDNDLHDVQFKVGHMLERSISCPICHPETTHEYGVGVLSEYFRGKMKLSEEEIEEGAIETDNGHVFDFLVYGKLVVHYFDSSYFLNHTKESSEMIALMAEFADEGDYDLLPVTYTDIKAIMNGEDLILEDGDDDEDEEE